MRNITTFLFISLIFIFSCNTEAKFGFLKKVKVENHSIAKTIAKPHLTKPEEKKVDTDTCEIITASIANEKIILTQTQKNNFSVAHSISIKKMLVDSTNQKMKSDETLPKKEINKNALIGSILGIIGFFSFLFGFAFPAFLVISFIEIPALILCLIGLAQIHQNPEKYAGKKLADIGISFFLIWLVFVLLLLALVAALSHMSVGGTLNVW